MSPIPPACRASMARAREHRYCPRYRDTGYCGSFKDAREMLRGVVGALRALRRQEEAGILAIAGRGAR